MTSTPSTLISFLKNVGAKPLKRLSQNFLVDKNVIKKIITAADVRENDIILEIGPGPGALTHALLEKKAKVIAIEKDKTFADILKKLPLKVYEEDFLKLPFIETDKKIKVVANLPYNIATPILFKLIQNQDKISSMTLMFQLEMASRILSPPNSKNYGAINALIDFYFDAKLLFEISKNSFLPVPHITSAIVGFVSKDIGKMDHEAFQAFIKNSFLQRRKKLFSILKNYYKPSKIEEAFSDLKINKDIRAENLKSLDFLGLFQKLNHC